MPTQSWVLRSGSSCFFALWQIVLRESRATLRKIALCESYETASSYNLSARKLQTLGKCSSTNLESFTFRLLTQLTQGIFLRSASFDSLFEVYFIKK